MTMTKPSSLCQFLIHTIAVLALLVPMSAFADIVYNTLPGNFSSGAAGLGDSRYAGFAFRTPPGQPYAIDSVRLNLWNNTNVPDPQFVVALYDDNAGDPGSLVATIGTGTMDPNFEVLEVATPATPVVLAADTVYWIMTNSPGNDIASVGWFGGGGSPAGSTFPHVRGPVLWTPSSFLNDITAVGNLHVEVNASLTEATYSVGGTVSGLTGTGLALQNNGGDTLAVAAAAAFTFSTELLDLAAYEVTVSTQPTGQTCSVTNGSGAIAAADVANIVVDCVDNVIPTYSVGGTVSGLTGTGLALQNNGGDTLAVAAVATAFTFSTELLDLAAYEVTVSTQPTGQTCSVTNGSGAIAAADVANIVVDCVNDEVPPIVQPTPAAPIPTLSQWALIMLSMFLGLMVFASRKRLF